MPIKRKVKAAVKETMTTLLKGKQYDIVSLKDQNNIAIKIVNPVVPQDDYSGYAQFTLEEETYILMSLSLQYNRTIYAKFYSSKLNSVIGHYLPKDFKVQKLTKKASKELMEKFEAWNFRNIINVSHACHIGADPEIFVTDDKDRLIPAFEFLGSKEAPSYTAPSLRAGNERLGNKPMYWDGFQAEFTTNPETCLGWQVDSIQCGLQGVYNAAKTYNKDAKLSLKTVMDIPPHMLLEGKEEHVSFGCMPSFNIYNMKGISLDGREVPFRPAGGHMHFGMTFSKVDVEKAVKALDAILAVACVALFANIDDPRRRKMYGLAGEYRLPPHGMEYRVLSNAWLCHPLITNLVFDVGRKAMMFGINGYLEKHWKATEQETIECINNCDVVKAKEILERNKNVFMTLLYRAYPALKEIQLEKLFNGFKNGVESIVVNPQDIEGNWNLNGTWVTHSEGTGKNTNKAVVLLVKDQKVS